MDQKIFTHPNKGSLSLGPHQDGSGDEQESGRGAIAIGQNTIAKGDGSVSQGYTDRKGGLVAEGLAARAQGVSLNESKVLASGETTYARGRAIDKSTIEARGVNTRAEGVANSGSVIEASGENTTSKGTAIQESIIKAEGKNSHAQGDALNSGVISAKGSGSTAEGVADGGYLDADGASVSVSGEARQFGTMRARGQGTRLTGYVEGEEEKPTKSIADGFNITADVYLRSGTFRATGNHSTIDMAIYNGAAEIEAPLSRINGIALNGNDRMESENPVTIVNGRNITTKSAYSVSTGFSGSQDDPLPSISLFAGDDRASLPAVENRVLAYGTVPLGYGSASGWRSSFGGYSEMFEWEDGNPLGEHRLGLFVTLNSDKIAICKDTEGVDGAVTSSKLGFVGSVPNDSYILHTDHLGRPAVSLDYRYSLNLWLIKNIKKGEAPRFIEEAINDPAELEVMKKVLGIPEDVLIEPVLRIDPSAVKKRTNGAVEVTHAAACLLGPVIVRDNGECQAGGRCDCKDGIAVPGSRWKVMKRQSNTTIKILMK